VTAGGGRRREKGPAPARTWVAWTLLGFAALVLTALAATPFLAERRVAGLLETTTEVLDPARHLAAELTAAHASEMVAIQSFLLSGEGVDRQAWRLARQRSQFVMDSLTGYTEALGPEVRLLAFDVADAALQWRILVDPVLEDRMVRTEFLEGVPNTRRAFQRVQQATLVLERGVASEAAAAAAGLRRASERQASFTALLAALGLLAAGGLVGVAIGLRRLAGDVEVRRRQADRARGEADAVLQATTDGVYGVDVSGRCTFVNSAGLRLLAIAGPTLRGRDLRSAFTVDQDRHPVDQVLEPGGRVDIPDALVTRRDGTTVHAAVTGRTVEGQGGSLAAVLTLSDISDMRDAADALRRAVAIREQVLAVVSHDLRNPVATVQAASELITEFDLPPERRAEQIQIIRRAGRRADRMIRDLLDSVAVERGGLSVNAVPMDAAGLPGAVAESMATVADRRQVRIETEVRQAPLLVEGDHDRLLQALENLVGNGTRYTPAHGRVMVRAYRSDTEIVLEVEDEGPGMDPARAESLFDPFVQFDTTDPRSAGLGLAIVRGVAEGHGGRVEVAEAPGGAAMFRIILPGAVAEETAADVNPEADAAADA